MDRLVMHTADHDVPSKGTEADVTLDHIVFFHWCRFPSDTTRRACRREKCDHGQHWRDVGRWEEEEVRDAPVRRGRFLFRTLCLAPWEQDFRFPGQDGLVSWSTRKAILRYLIIDGG